VKQPLAVVDEEASRLLDMLASAPYMNATVTSAVAKQFLLKTGGRILARGESFDVKAKSLGAGVYRVSLVRRS
jgi:hypothetical protein